MILVTGGTGFIGSNLVAALEAQGKQVMICDWLGNDEKWRNVAKRDLQGIIAPQQLGAFLADEGDEIEAVFHLGAISTTTETNVDLIFDTNVNLSQSLYKWCTAQQIPLIYASSAATYGDGAQGFADDGSSHGLAKLRPLNAYGWSKHCFDRWVARQYIDGKNGPPQCIGLKFFNVYGPNEYHKAGQRSVAHQIYPVAAAGEAFALFKSHNPKYPDGGQLRDFVWVGDCVKVMLWFYAHPDKQGLFNLGTGKARSFLDLAKAIYAATGKPASITYRDMPPELLGKYQYFTEADMSRLRGIGYTASFTSLEDGVNEYVHKYLATSDPYL